MIIILTQYGEMKEVLKMAKGKPTTMRFDEEIESYINSFLGNNFTDKFENMVRKFKDEEPNLEIRLNRLKNEIKTAESKLQEMNGMMKDTRWLDSALTNLQKDIKRSRDCFDEYLRRNTKIGSSQLGQD